MENTTKPITDHAFKLISELKYNMNCIVKGDESIKLESVKTNMTTLRNEFRELDFEEEVDVLEGLESVVDSMIKNKMSESAELFELIISGLEHTEKVLQIKGVMKKDLSKNLQATFQNLPTNFSPIAGKEKNGSKKNGNNEIEKPEENQDEAIVNFATGRKAKSRKKDAKTVEKKEKEGVSAPSAGSEDQPSSSENKIRDENVQDKELNKIEKTDTVAENTSVKSEKGIDTDKGNLPDNQTDENKKSEPSAQSQPEKENVNENSLKDKTIELNVEKDSLEEEKLPADVKNEEIIQAEESENEKEETETSDSSDNVITLSELTIHSIEKTKRIIDERLKENKKVKIKAENVTAIDLSYIQLIISIQKNGTSENVSFEFEGELREDLQLLLNNNGFSGIA